MQTAYVGSANLTGAHNELKGEFNHNFKSGVLTNEPGLANAAVSQFDSIWMGIFCLKCKHKDFCQDKIIQNHQTITPSGLQNTEKWIRRIQMVKKRID